MKLGGDLIITNRRRFLRQSEVKRWNYWLQGVSGAGSFREKKASSCRQYLLKVIKFIATVPA